MRHAAAFLAFTLLSSPAWAGEARQVPHGMEVTTDAGETVRVLAYADGTFRVTVAKDLPEGRPTPMVVAEPDGEPQFSATAEAATLMTAHSQAIVGLSDGRLTVYDAAGKLLLDEYAPARRLTPLTVEGQPWLATRAQFNRGTDEGLYGLGQHQNRQMNYNGEDVELAQHNMAIAIPYLLSTRGYAILWDNASITRVGDPEPYELVRADERHLLIVSDNASVARAGDPEPSEVLRADPRHDPVICLDECPDTYPREIEVRWQAEYRQNGRLVSFRPEDTIDFQYIRDLAGWPKESPAADTDEIVWSGTYTPATSGLHKFRLYSSSYVKVFADGTEVLSRWRQNWNPWYHNFELDLERGKPVDLRVEWLPNQGYIALEHADPLPEADRHSVSFASEAGKAIDYYVVPGASMDALVAGYRRLTGKAPMMPRWAYGFWQSRQRYETQESLLGVLRQYRDARIPIDAIVQDWFYWPENAWGCHCFDPARFPDPEAMVREVHDLDARIMISVWPKFYPTTAHGQELAAKHYLYPRPLEAGQRDWVGPGYANTYYDPYAAEARDIYFRQIRETLVAQGFDAWWMDATEPDWHSNLSVEERAFQMTSPATGVPGAAIFNSYPLVHAEGMAEGLRAAQPDRRPFILTRSGFGGIQRASAALWSGDVAARWDDLRDQVSAGSNLSISGIPNWTHDIGGFALEERYSKELPEALPEWRELYLRWFQFGAFSPLFRSHGEFPLRETPIIARDDPAMLEGLTYYHRLRYRLLPYIYTLAAGTHFDDGTIMRPLVMDFAADREVWEFDDAYMFGPALLVAPVSVFEAREWDVYLPAGSAWFEIETGRRFAGGDVVTVDAPRERIPVFARAGAIVPLGPDVQSTGENPQGPLTVHVFPGTDGAFTLYEDQGEDMGYTRGEFARIPFAWDDSARTLTIGAREGRFPGMAATRRIGIVVHGDGAAGPVFAREPARAVDYDGSAVTLAF